MNYKLISRLGLSSVKTPLRTFSISNATITTCSFPPTTISNSLYRPITLSIPKRTFTQTNPQLAGGFKPNKQKQHHPPVQPSSTTNRSGVKYAQPEPITQPVATTKVVYNNAAEAKRAHAGPAEDQQTKDMSSQSVLEILNKIRNHKVYQLTRMFMMGSVLILLTKRIGEAKMLPDEIFEEGDSYPTQLQKTCKKTFRVMLATITRTWTPFGSIDDQGSQ